MKNKVKKIVGYYFLLLVGLLLILVGYVWFVSRQNLIRLNLAQPNFPYTRYSDEDLEEKFPQYPNEKVETTQTPEQTYAKFIDALKKGDVEGMRGLFYGNKYDEYEKYFLDDIKNNKLDETIKLFDRQLILKDDLETMRGYNLDGFGDKYIIEFIKDLDGIWKIDSF
ncbi:MAG TPA: hypothetical protein PLD97_01995 [bacterium]|nr:hypothetical protein [bacterium]